MTERIPDDRVAAPPDSGTHQGAFSTPDELLQRRTENTPTQAPALHKVDPVVPMERSSRGAGFYTVCCLAVVGLVLLLAALVGA
jgi:hypothetical protein